MIKGEKILITGVNGVVARPIAEHLAQNNEVWGFARFQNEAVRSEIEAAGITPYVGDLASGEFDNLPTDFTYLLHLAWARLPIEQLDDAMRINVEGTGFILHHCRNVKAALCTSGMGIYTAHDDPLHKYTETDPIGRGATAYAATSPASKLGMEAVARFCARNFNIPVTIARLNTVFGPLEAYHANYMRKMLNDEPVMVPGVPSPHTQIHTDDMKWQVEPLLEAAGSPALITNWCGDETITTQECGDLLFKLSGKKAIIQHVHVPGAPPGNAADNTKRLSITGPCQVKFEEAYKRLYQEVTADPNG